MKARPIASQRRSGSRLTAHYSRWHCLTDEKSAQSRQCHQSKWNEARNRLVASLVVDRSCFGRTGSTQRHWCVDHTTTLHDGGAAERSGVKRRRFSRTSSTTSMPTLIGALRPHITCLLHTKLGRLEFLRSSSNLPRFLELCLNHN